MVKRFLDLHVYSSKSIGKNSREDLKTHADLLDTEISFCDGLAIEEGLCISFKTKPELKKNLSPSSYLILESLSKESLQTAVKTKHCIINTKLSPTIAKALNRNKCAIEVRLSPLFGSRGIKRIRAIREIKTNLTYARKYGVPVVATTGASSIFELRSPNQVFDLLKVLGLTDFEAKEAMYTNPKNIIEFGKEKVGKKIISNHVRIL
jgi:RNase P/RNase MRP subunit p30